MNGSPPEIIISISGSSALCPTSGIERAELVGVELAEPEGAEPALRDAGEDHAVFVDREPLADVGHDVEHVLLRGTEVAAAPTAAERRHDDRGEVRTGRGRTGVIAACARWLLPVPCRNTTSGAGVGRRSGMYTPYGW